MSSYEGLVVFLTAGISVGLGCISLIKRIKMKTLKIWVLCLLLGTVWDVCLARDLKQNKDTTTKVASVDGPYVLIRPVSSYNT